MLLSIESAEPMSVAETLALMRREARAGSTDTGRYRCRFTVWGDGPPLVFVHGLSDVAQSFALVMAHLRRDFTCIAYELPTGRGDGAKLGRYKHQHLADDLFALLDFLGLKQTYLFASSFGTTVSIRAMAAEPSRFVRAIFQGGFAYRPVGAQERMMCQVMRYLPGPMRSLPLRTTLSNREEHAIIAAGPRDRFDFMLDNCGGVPIATVARIALMIDAIDLRHLLPKIPRPVLLIGGDQDHIVPRECEMQLLAGLPFADRAEIPDCGHVPQYTHAPLVAELTRRFLTPPACEQ